MYTGLPLIPAMTPVLASGPPSSFARMRLRCVPMTFSSTPMMCALNSSTWVPSNTVRPTPTMPGRTSPTLICVGAPEVSADAATTIPSRLKSVRRKGMIHFDTDRRPLVWSNPLMPQSFAPELSVLVAPRACAGSWRWYWGSTEEASALA